MAKVFSEFTFYSPMLDAVAVRISTVDAHGSEFFAIIPKPPLGKSLREAREKALSAIEAAIESGLVPGEVRIQA